MHCFKGIKIRAMIIAHVTRFIRPVLIFKSISIRDRAYIIQTCLFYKNMFYTICQKKKSSEFNFSFEPYNCDKHDELYIELKSKQWPHCHSCHYRINPKYALTDTVILHTRLCSNDDVIMCVDNILRII